jgi:MFS family permease
MYAFRKPFSVATFESLSVFGIDYKIILIIAQVLGYTLSKFLGIRIISALKTSKRIYYLIGLILVAELALVLFAIVPQPYNVIFLFFNGLPLGMIWGIVFSYLEGRKYTEILGVALCSSFIVSSGIVKSVGLYVMNIWLISEFWMPAATGALFIVPLLFFAWLLEKLPEATQEDNRLRSVREPMLAKDRKQLLSSFLIPIVGIVVFYTVLTIFRDFRDNFARELWDSIGYKGDVAVYTTSETIIAVVVLLILGSTFYIKNNVKALYTYHLLILIGVVCIGVSTFLFQLALLDPFIWMVICGFGLYICYVPFNCLFFDRFIAAFKIKGNAGFLIYIADSFGYLGSITALLYKNFGQAGLSWLDFFVYGAYTIAVLGIFIITGSLFYFTKAHYSQLKMIQTELHYEKI